MDLLKGVSTLGASAVTDKFDSLADNLEKNLLPDKKMKEQKKKEKRDKQDEKERIKRVEELEKRRRQNQEKAEKIRSKYGIGHEAKAKYSRDRRKSLDLDKGSYCYDCVIM